MSEVSHRTRLSIDAHLLHEAQSHYASSGFIDTATPWLVTNEAYMATCPPEVAESMQTWRAPSGLFHVASAEQGFIQLLLDGTHVPTKAQSTTPCFRWEPVFDKLHLPFFYKLELYDSSASEESLFSMIALARKLFTTQGMKNYIEPQVDGSYDIVDTRGNELGSYGIRQALGFAWTYGTGIALPRFQQLNSDH